MLSTRLLRLIESNSDEIAARLIRVIRERPDTPNLAARPDIELREWCREVMESVSRALSGTGKKDWGEFEEFGKVRFGEHIPLHEAVLRIHELKDQILGFVAKQGLPLTALNLYAEEELVRSLARFLDAMVYHLVLGYEEAQGVAARVKLVRGSGSL